MRTDNTSAVGWWALLAVASAFNAPAAGLSLTFTNRPSDNTAGVSNFARVNLLTRYTCTQSNHFQSFRGVFTAASNTSKLAIHSDDGSKVLVNGSLVVNKFGVETHLEDLASSFSYISYAFTNGGEYCVEITYTNHLHTPSDSDGVTLYAYAGGGFVRDGIILRGTNWLCPGNTVTLWTECGTSPITWTSSHPNVATVNSSGMVTGIQDGTTTITATDAEGKTGTKPIAVATPRITPTPFATAVGVTNAFALTNVPASGFVIWNPEGSLSADWKTNRVVLTNAGSNVLVTAAYRAACTATATGVVVTAGGLTGSAVACVGEPVIYTAFTVPSGFEGMLNWSGEGLSGNGARRTNTYSLAGMKVVSVACGTSVQSFTNTVYRMEMTPTAQTVLAESASPVTFALAPGYGPAFWQIAPPGQAAIVDVNEGTASVYPGAHGSNYTVSACAVDVTNCCASAALQVVQVRFSTNGLALCEASSAPLTVTVTPPGYLAQLTFDTVTNVTSGPSNTSATITPGSGSTNLTVTGVAAGTATVRVRLGNSVAFGPTVKTVRVTFPSNAWYVAQGEASYFGATVVPAANAEVVSYVSANPGLALISGTGANLTGIGVTNGTTQVLAKVGGQTCAAKDLNVVGVRLAPDEMALCVGKSTNVTAIIDPPSSPVTFTMANPNIASLTRNGNTLTVTSLVAGDTFIVTWLNGAFVSVAPVYGIEVKFPTNEFYVPQGGTNYLPAHVLAAFQGSKVTFATTDPGIAAVVSGSTPQRVGVRGVTNGTTTLLALVETNLYCVFKNATVLPSEKLPLGQALTRNRPGFFKVYVPTRWGGKLTITNTAGTITDLRSPLGLPFANGANTGIGGHGWYTFCVPDSSSYTVSNSFAQSKTVSKAPWTCHWYPMSEEQGGNLYSPGRCLERYDTAYTRASRAVEKQNWVRRLLFGQAGDFIAKDTLRESDAERTWGYDLNNADGDSNVWTGWDANATWDFWNGIPPTGDWASVLGPDGDTVDNVDASYFGHCPHAASVVICENEPTGNYNAPNGVVFTPDLKKGLLVALYHDARASFSFGPDVLPHIWHKSLEETLIGHDTMMACDVHDTGPSQDIVWIYPIYAITKAEYVEKPGQSDERMVEIKCEAKCWALGPSSLYYWYGVRHTTDGVAGSSNAADWKNHPYASSGQQRPDTIYLPIRQTSIAPYWQGQLDYGTIRAIVPAP